MAVGCLIAISGTSGPSRCPDPGHSSRAFGKTWETIVQFKRVLVIGGVTLLGAVSGCASGSLFGFPVEQGDIAAGRQAFVDHRCHQCHSIAGERLPPLAGADRPILELGGQTTHVRSYGDLTTSIINPDHAISERYRDQELLLNAQLPLETPMPMPNIDTMSVRQLIDIVAFLDSKYELTIEDYE
jgi:L-cysteine S-thiosulfotransferase